MKASSRASIDRAKRGRRLANIDNIVHRLPWGDFKHVKLKPRQLSIWAGDTGIGKSTIMNMVALSLAKQGAGVWIDSQEMPEYDTMESLATMLRRERMSDTSEDFDAFIQPLEEWLDEYSITTIENKIDSEPESQEDRGRELEKKIKKAEEDGVETQMEIVKQNIKKAKADGASHYIIDNLMTLADSSYDFAGQEQIIKDLAREATNNNIHIHLVCHNKKQSRDASALDSIAGTASVSRLAAYVFLLAPSEKSRMQPRVDEKSIILYDMTLSIIKERYKGRDFVPSIGLNFDDDSTQMTKTGKSINFKEKWNE